MRWDVYIWPIDNPGNVRLVAKDVNDNSAEEISRRYFDTNIYDTYLVPTGTKLFV